MSLVTIPATALSVLGGVLLGYVFKVGIADPLAPIVGAVFARAGSAGSGDVLTGTIGSLLAQGCEPLRAALVGCWLHGRAGELGGEIFPAAVPAGELPGLLADAWRELEESDQRPQPL